MCRTSWVPIFMADLTLNIATVQSPQTKTKVFFMFFLPRKHHASFAQRRYRSQWGLSEARLLLVENYTQYPALTTWKTVGCGNLWRVLWNSNNSNVKKSVDYSVDTCADAHWTSAWCRFPSRLVSLPPFCHLELTAIVTTTYIQFVSLQSPYSILCMILFPCSVMCSVTFLVFFVMCSVTFLVFFCYFSWFSFFDCWLLSNAPPSHHNIITWHQALATKIALGRR